MNTEVKYVCIRCSECQRKYKYELDNTAVGIYRIKNITPRCKCNSKITSCSLESERGNNDNNQ